MRLRNVRRFPKPMPEETKEKISKANKGRKVSKETILQRTNTRMRKHPVWHTRETRQKIGDALRGRKVSDETKKKISEKMKGRKLSLTARSKLCVAKTPAVKQKISDSLKAYHARLKKDRENGDEDVAAKIVETRAANQRKKARRRLYEDK